MGLNHSAKRRHLKFEALDPRLVLSASPIAIDVAADWGDGAVVENYPARTSFLNLSVPTAESEPALAAENFLNAHHAQLGLPVNVTENLELLEVKHGLASSHVRFTQSEGGITVNDAFVSVHMDQHGVVQTVHNAYRDLALDTAQRTPLVELASAIGAAEDFANVESTFAEPKSDLVWNVGKDGTANLAWRVTVYGYQPAGDFLTLVDAASGTVLQQENRMAFATGTADVFEPNPYQTKGNGSGLSDSNDANSSALSNQLVSVTLEGLDDGTGLLNGEFVNLASLNSPDLADVDANEPTRVYEYTRDDPRFEQAVVYHSVDQINRYFHSLGFDDDNGTPNGIRDFPTLANAHWYTADNSYYSTGDDAIHFGDGGVDDAEDADIVAHEYGHAVQHDQNALWGGGEMGAMGEGFGDYLAATFYADAGDAAFQSNHAAAVGEWDATSYSSANPPNLRRVDGNKLYPNDLNGSVHSDGEIWSAALWDIRAAIGATTTDQLVLESHFALPGSASMRDGANAILAADNNINGGANSTDITFWFEERGILGDVPADDHGNDAGSATSVGLNSTVTGAIEYGSDVDWFAFTVPAGANVTLATSLGSLSDTVLWLYNTNGTSQIRYDDDGGPGLASRINWTATNAGTYYAVVGSYSSNTGSYSLDVDSDLVGVTGDFDSDGDYDCDDVDALVGVIASASGDSAYDLSGDGAVNMLDLDAWLLEAGEANLGAGTSYLYGDANLDGVVDVSDFNLWNLNKFLATATWCQGDFNADGVTDVSDFNIWNLNKFQSSLVLAPVDSGRAFAAGRTVEVEYDGSDAVVERVVPWAPLRSSYLGSDRLAGQRTLQRASLDVFERVFENFEQE